MQPAVKAMTRLGFFKVMAISTVFSAFMSTFVAWVFGFFIDVPNYDVHIKLAFIIPFFVSPGFSYFTALAMKELKRVRMNAQKAARLDHLTEVFNRRAFFEAETRALEKYRPEERRKILFIDIDHFKGINDRFGHEGGDEVLREFARLLRSNLRKDDLVARFGGEEFVIELPGASMAEADAIAERIRARGASLRRRLPLQPHRLHRQHRHFERRLRRPAGPPAEHGRRPAISGQAIRPELHSPAGRGAGNGAGRGARRPPARLPRGLTGTPHQVPALSGRTQI